MNGPKIRQTAIGCLLIGLAAWSWLARFDSTAPTPAGRQEVVFWHFWGGEDRKVVQGVIDRFNQSQEEYFVRAVAMPGNNLDLKLFLAVTGGDPPDLINQDDPIVADWAHRGALVPLDELATSEEMAQLDRWLFPAARRLGSYRGRLYGLCNGLDIRALYYNQTLLDAHQLDAPKTIRDLDAIAEALAPSGRNEKHRNFGYLPDPRRLWAWGVVFGGEFYDRQSGEILAKKEPIIEALTWMTQYRQRYGAQQITAFRHGDQSLPGKTFPLLAGRYAVVMDGQWRVRDIDAWQRAQREAGKPVAEFGVCPLPPPEHGKSQAGWVNGNFFLVPRGAKNRDGAWALMKFWSGLGGNEKEAAKTCAAGGWIPVSAEVVRQEEFQRFLNQQPLFAPFVEMAGSENQQPTPVIPGAPYFYQEIVNAAETAMYDPQSPPPRELIEQAAQRIERRLKALKD